MDSSHTTELKVGGSLTTLDLYVNKLIKDKHIIQLSSSFPEIINEQGINPRIGLGYGRVGYFQDKKQWILSTQLSYSSINNSNFLGHNFRETFWLYDREQGHLVTINGRQFHFTQLFGFNKTYNKFNLTSSMFLELAYSPKSDFSVDINTTGPQYS